MTTSLAMTREEREAFLAEVHVGVIGIECRDSAPLAVPIWYDYSPERGVWILTDPRSRKGQALAAAGRFSLCAQVEAPPYYRYVSVSGAIIEQRPADRESDSRPMARRYLGKELGDLYIETTPGNSDLYVMRPERWLTVDYAKNPVPSG